MTEIATITTTLGAITNAIAIAKTIKNTDSTLEKAELKLKIAELMESLADAKISVSEFQDIVKEKDKKIAELEGILTFKSKLTRHLSAYYETDQNSKPFGDPYCSNCWETSYKAVHLHESHNDYEVNLCPFCKTEYNAHFTPIQVEKKLR